MSTVGPRRLQRLHGSVWLAVLLVLRSGRGVRSQWQEAATRGEPVHRRRHSRADGSDGSDHSLVPDPGASTCSRTSWPGRVLRRLAPRAARKDCRAQGRRPESGEHPRPAHAPRSRGPLQGVQSKGQSKGRRTFEATRSGDSGVVLHGGVCARHPYGSLYPGDPFRRDDPSAVARYPTPTPRPSPSPAAARGAKAGIPNPRGGAGG